MKKILLITAGLLSPLLMLGACSQQKDNSIKIEPPAKTNAQTQTLTQNEKLDAWFEEIFQRELKKSPMFMTTLGIKTDNNKWDDESKIAYLDKLDRKRQDLDHMRKTFDKDTLDKNHALSYRLFETSAKQDIQGERWWDYTYTFNQMFGPQSDIPAFLINRHRVDDIDDAKAYIARLDSLDGYMGTLVSNAHKSAKKGIMPPKFVYAHVIRDAKNIITGEPFTDGDLSTLLDDFQSKIRKLNLPEAKEKTLLEAAIKALLTSVKPAYENLIAEMEDQQANANTDDGAWKLPDGADYYKYRLKKMTTTDMTPSEIHDLGLSEVARIHGEMRKIMKQVGYKGSLQEFFTNLKNDPKQYYEDSSAGRAAYLKDAVKIIATMKTRLDDVFLVKPKTDLIVKQVEAFREKSAGKAFYNRPAADGSRPGIYYVNLYKTADMPKYQMEALAYHEGIPGHHMQIAIQQELKNIPNFRKFSQITAYSEGWGLYSEFLPKEMGFYQDPYSDFGRLSMELWRAARLVVDTGIHDKKWTREQAIDYLLANTPNSENDCVKSIERYIVMPGQATAYKIGMLKILGLREEAKKTLGDKFDLREYHNVIISSGPVPLNIMEERVNAWVAGKE
ncbi:MAG: DUF885 domain-containing protein [Robiginitomaculum sp.]